MVNQQCYLEVLTRLWDLMFFWPCIINWLYNNYQLWCTDYYLFIKYYSPLHVSSLKMSTWGSKHVEENSILWMNNNQCIKVGNYYIDKVMGICSEENTRNLARYWILHHDNAPAHEALRVHEFLANNSITKMDRPPYSPDLAPCDFWLFPKLKMSWRDKDLLTFLISNFNVKTLVRGIPENDFQDCFRQWHHRLTKCIASQGEYYEGDSSRQCTGKQILLSQFHSGN